MKKNLFDLDNYFNIKYNNVLTDGQEDMIFMWSYSLNSHFHLIMELCSDISLLGLKLLKTAQSLLGRYISTHDEKKNGNSRFLRYYIIFKIYDNIYFCLLHYSFRIENNSGIINKIPRLFHGFL